MAVLGGPGCAGNLFGELAAGAGFDDIARFVENRLARGEPAVVDVEGWQSGERKSLAAIARRSYCDAVAIIAGSLPATVSAQQLAREGFKTVHVADRDALAGEIEIIRVPLDCNKAHEQGPFDLIGDLHGCAAELRALLEKLGWHSYSLDRPASPWASECWRHPDSRRRAVFLGDLVDRGPAILETLRIVRNMVQAGRGYCVIGNHDDKLARWLDGRAVNVGQGLETSVAELEPLAPEDKAEIRTFLAGLPAHYVFDGGRLVAAHAGLIEAMQGRSVPAVRAFCLYGETTGETDEHGLPVRGNWAAKYRGQAAVVYGHTPVAEPEWVNNTLNIDTGAVYGRRLTALRYPERELVSVPAERQYATRARPIV